MAAKGGSVKSPVGLAAKLGVEVVGETIEGVFGLASATVTAAGEAAKGVGMAVGGALQGALSPAPVTIINSVGMTGGAGKAKVTGGGTIPAAPKKSAKPAVNSKMATEKLLVVAVNYLSSIEKTLVDQLNFERIAAAQQAQAQRENAIESGGESASPYKSLGEKLGAIKEAGADKVATATKVILGGAALASLGLLGLGQLDTTELDQLKQNWKEFQDNIEPMLEVVRKVQEFIGDEATLGAAIGLAVAGPKGGIIGLIAGLVYGLTGSPELAAAAGGAGIVLAISKKARVFTGNAAKAAGRAAGRSAYNLAGRAVVELITNPAARLATAAGGLAASATGSILYGIDQLFKYTAGSAINAVEKYEQSYGLFVQEIKNEGGGVLSRVKYKIKINERKINYFNVPKKEIEGRDHNEKERFYYWNQVHLAATEGRFGSGPAAANWLQTQGPAWLNKRFPIKTNATAVPTTAGSGTANASPVASSSATPNATPSTDMPALPPAAAGSIDAILDKNPESLSDAELRQLVEAQGRIEDPRGVMNNPGGIRYGTGPLQDHQIGFRGANADSSVKIAVYDTPENGIRAAMENWRTSRYYKGHTVRDGLGMWSTGHYGRNANYEKMLGSAAPGYTGTTNPQGESGSMLSSLGDLTKGGMEAIGIIARAAFGKQKAQSGSQLDGFNDNMQGNAATVARNQEGAAGIAQLSRISAQIQTATEFGATNKTQTETKQQSAGSASGGKPSSSNDSKREHFDPNFPGKGSLEAYMQYYKPKMAA